MDENASFVDLLQRARCGDAESTSRLVRLYEADLKRIIRVRLTDTRLRSQMDSADIYQSVMCDFFAQLTLGQFELESPRQLSKLLATIARHKLFSHFSKQRAGRRDIRKLEVVQLDKLSLERFDESPSQIVSNRELTAKFRERLTDDERYLADQRANGRPWSELAKESQENVDALRKRLQRAIERVAEELGGLI